MPKALVFVVHEHHASQLHYDLRLELHGVLRSWAVPKGPPLTAGVKRLAVAVPDHQYSYKDFEGTIPEGNYGAGKVKIWDKGTYCSTESESLDDQYSNGSMDIKFVGNKLSGNYMLIRTKRDKQWLLFKK